VADFDFSAAHKKISEINKIVDSCAEPVKVKAFELLFEQVFGPTREKENTPTEKPKAAETRTSEKETPPASAEIKLPSNVQAFLRRHQIPKDVLDKLFMLDQEPMLPIYKIESKVVSQGAIQKVLMIMLENALLNNQFKAPYREVRETCKEDGLVDSNFTTNLKKSSALFKGAITADAIDDNAAVELTGDGQARLAEVMKELSGMP
jgi:hypothetical protein